MPPDHFWEILECSVNIDGAFKNDYGGAVKGSRGSEQE
jgi:hypothetical protein